jgi:hypothetical protein
VTAVWARLSRVGLASLVASHASVTPVKILSYARDCMVLVLSHFVVQLRRFTCGSTSRPFTTKSLHTNTLTFHYGVNSVG